MLDRGPLLLPLHCHAYMQIPWSSGAAGLQASMDRSTISFLDISQMLAPWWLAVSLSMPGSQVHMVFEDLAAAGLQPSIDNGNCF